MAVASYLVRHRVDALRRMQRGNSEGKSFHRRCRIADRAAFAISITQSETMRPANRYNVYAGGRAGAAFVTPRGRPRR